VGQIGDAAAIYDGLISSRPNDFRGYLAKVHYCTVLYYTSVPSGLCPVVCPMVCRRVYRVVCRWYDPAACLLCLSRGRPFCSRARGRRRRATDVPAGKCYYSTV